MDNPANGGQHRRSRSRVQPELPPPSINEPVSSADSKMHKLLRRGVRLLLLGVSPERFIDGPWILAAMLWTFLGVFYAAFTVHEILGAVVFAPSLLGAVGHAYVASYVGSFTFQWAYFFTIVPKIYDTRRLRLDDFHCAKSQPRSTEMIVDEVLKSLTRVLNFATGWLTLNTMSHFLGPIIEAAMTYFEGGRVEAIFMLPQVFPLTFGGQVIMYAFNAVTTGGLLFYCAGAYTVLGVEVAKIKVLCETLNEALQNASNDKDVHKLIRDHVMIMKRAKELNEDLAVLNMFVFTSGYLEFATQMFVITFFDLNMSYYVALPVDMFSILLLVTLQCFMGSNITDSLQSIAKGPYGSEWYEWENGLTKHVILMTQMAQNTVEPTIWFGSVKVERATILNLLRSSYAAYTVLMIFQK